MFAHEQLDLVVVCVPHDVGRVVIEAAAERHIHVLEEKPFATTVGEAKELAEICQRSGIRLMVTLQRRFNPIYTSFTQLADQIGTSSAKPLEQQGCREMSPSTADPATTDAPTTLPEDGWHQWKQLRMMQRDLPYMRWMRREVLPVVRRGRLVPQVLIDRTVGIGIALVGRTLTAQGTLR